MPRFSVVLPARNAAETLPDTLNSLAAQSFTDFELIAVEDDSTDDTPGLLEAFGQKEGISTTLVKGPGKGLGAARNAGIARARGSWVALLDADDIWQPQKLAAVAEAISSGKSGVFYHAVQSFGLARNRVRPARPVAGVQDLLTKGNPLVPSASVISRQVLLDYPFSENPDHHGAEDLHLWVRLLHAGISFHPLRGVYTLYRESGGMSTDLLTHLQHVQQVLEDLQGQGLLTAELVELAWQRKHYEAGRFYHKRNQFTEALQHYRQAGTHWPWRLLAALRIGI